MTIQTHHACALEVTQIGILIQGSSGSGKTSLMMGLLERAKQENLDGFLIADDQVFLTLENTSLIAKAPETISGLIEIRGFGVVSHSHKQTGIIKLVVELVDDEEIDRMPEQEFWKFETQRLPLLKVPIRHESQSVRIVFAWLFENSHLYAI